MTNKQSQQSQQEDADIIEMLRNILEVSREKNQQLSEQLERLNLEHIQLKLFISRADPDLVTTYKLNNSKTLCTHKQENKQQSHKNRSLGRTTNESSSVN